MHNYTYYSLHVYTVYLFLSIIANKFLKNNSTIFDHRNNFEKLYTLTSRHCGQKF